MSENESEFFKLKDDVQQAFLFRDRVMTALGNPNDAIAQIKELAEIKAEIAFGTIGKLSDQDDDKKTFAEDLKELLEQERSDSRNLCNQIADLRHDLLIANKVIARLVGE
jgi:hypothetical protein